MPELRIKRMVIVCKWNTGDIARMYSPREKSCNGRFRKMVGGWLVTLGSGILFGFKGWKTYINEIEGEVTVDA